MAHDDILQLGLDLLKGLGEYMNYTSKKLYIYRTINIVVLAFSLSCIFANLAFAEGGKFVETIEGGSTVFHIFLKYVMFIYYKSDIQVVLAARKKFWSYRMSGKENYQKSKIIFKYVKLSQRFMAIAITFSVTLHWLRPYYNEDKRLIFECWTYSNSIIFEVIVLIFQCYLLTMTVPVVVGYDSVYFSYSIHVILQTRLLNYKLKYITSRTHKEDVNKYINYHNFLLSIFNRLSGIYFWMFLFHYFITLTTSCTQLYFLFLGKAETMIPIVYNIVLFIEFGYYAFPAEEIVFQIKDLSNAIYQSRWYKSNVTIQKMLLLMMVKSQQQQYMLVGGMRKMNVDAFGSVVRKSFSFFTVIRNFLNK